jgi:beta-glucosidase
LIGGAPVGITYMPASDKKQDIEQARELTLSITKKDFWNNTWFADPMLHGHYPEDGLKLFGSDVPDFPDSDMSVIKQPLDFYGVNIYHGMTLSYNKIRQSPYPGCGITTMDWQVTPQALYWGPKFLYERYGLPLVITENGMANTDWIQSDGKIHDPQRIDFMKMYLDAYRSAIGQGTKAIGYFYWSVMNNFEWAEGYRRRFGLIYVDYRNQKRVLKDSAFWYREVINSNGAII